MKITWQTWTNNPSPGDLGHGLCIFDRNRQHDDRIIAFVEGYAWYHGCSENVIIYSIKPDAITTTEILQDLRKILEGYIKPKMDLSQRMLNPRIEVWANA
jgi:hypothetical protein